MKTRPAVFTPAMSRARLRRQRHGSIVILALLMIVVSLAAAAMCIDIAYMQLVQTQLRSATDAAARAGVEGLAQGLPMKEARKLGQEVALANSVAGAPLQLAKEDFVFGIAAPNPEDPTGRYLLTPSDKNLNAVRVVGRRTADSPSGGVTLFLGGKLFGTGPFEPTRAAAAAIADRDIVLVVDRSSSMGGEDSGTLPESIKDDYKDDPVYDHDGDGNLRRIEALKVAVSEFRKVIDAIPSIEHLGLVAYDATSRVDATLSGDYTLFDNKMYTMDLGSGTNIGAGIDEGLAMLQDPAQRRPNAVPIMIVLTDGNHNGDRDPVAAAQDAMFALPRLTIHTVTFSDEANQALMQNVASIGGGIHVHAADVSQLVGEFEQMAAAANAILIE